MKKFNSSLSFPALYISVILKVLRNTAMKPLKLFCKQMLRAQLERSQKSAERANKEKEKAKVQLAKKRSAAAADPKLLEAKEKKEMNKRKKKTLASLKRLTASPPPPPPPESTDTSEAEENVTAAILSTLNYKQADEKSEGEKGPLTRSRKNKNV